MIMAQTVKLAVASGGDFSKAAQGTPREGEGLFASMMSTVKTVTEGSDKGEKDINVITELNGKRKDQRKSISIGDMGLVLPDMALNALTAPRNEMQVEENANQAEITGVSILEGTKQVMDIPEETVQIPVSAENLEGEQARMPDIGTQEKAIAENTAAEEADSCPLENGNDNAQTKITGDEQTIVKTAEAPKTETPAVDTTKGAAETETQESGTVKTEAPAAETVEAETADSDAPKTDAPKTETVNNDAPKADPAKTETAAKAETADDEAPDSDAPKTETPKADAEKATEKPKTETKSANEVKVDQPANQPVNVAPEKASSGIQMRAAAENLSRTPAVSPDNLFDTMVERIEVQKQAESSQMSIQLKPEFLGKVSLEMTMSGGNMQLKISAEDADVKSMINGQITSLVETLSNKGIKVTAVDVVYTGVPDGGLADSQGGGQGSQGEKSSSKSGRSVKAGGIDFRMDLPAIEQMTMDVETSSVEYSA